MRELLLRHEKAADAMIDRFNALTRHLDAKTDAIIRRTDEVVAQMEAQRREFVDEMQAQRSALFRILDRLDEGGSTAGA